MARRIRTRGTSGRRRPPTAPRADYDSPWKEALDHYFERCIAFFFPHIHAEIDWTRGYEMLDKELQPIVRRSRHGRRHVDKLVKVYLKDGQERWILLHIEVQARKEGEFPERMYVYNTRLFDRYGREVISLAILADDDPDWRPGRYEYSRWGFRRVWQIFLEPSVRIGQDRQGSFPREVLAMESTPKLSRPEFIDRMRQKVEEALGHVADAVNEALPGQIIAGSEEPVRDTFADLRREAYEMAVQMRLDAAEAAFPPSEGPGYRPDQAQ